jgi:serine/threonine protein kinase/thiol-disulfide isomerase/thioredoxin
MLTPNSTLQNRYRVVRELGHGGMGTVYEAIDQRVSCVVALKETLVGVNTEARQAFQREAALLANLRHASLPKVMDYFSEGDGEFLVMEYIAGHDLAELIEQQQAPFPPDQVLVWADKLLQLLDYLHTREPPIVHRDIKPANLKITSEGEIFLLDFGLAKGAAGQMTTVRTDGSVHGYTPLYAPLEQIHGRGTDPRTDIYSLGATLYDLLAGQPPVAAPVRFEAIENDQPDPLPTVNRLNSRVSAAVAEVIQRAMALSRRERFSSAAEMLDALHRAKEIMAELQAAREAAAKALHKNRAESQADPDKPLVADDNVEFTVYAPRQIKPEKNYTMLAFAHLAKKRDDAPDDERDPIEEMKDQAARILGKQQADYDNANEPAGQPVPREGEITFVPIVPGITFSPASRTFTWRKSVHREEFDLWAAPGMDGKNLSGHLTVFLGSLVIAEVPLKVSVNSRAASAAEKISPDAVQSARRLRQIFASYSHQDEPVVAELAQVAPLFGSRFVLDRTHLDPGEDRREGLQRLIRGADMFQLFWSTNAMRSADTVDEINYAVSLGREGFILPTYWEEPLPRSPAEQLPPPAIERLQFHRIYPGAISQARFGDTTDSRVVILGPPGAEVYIDDERYGSVGSSGRVILKLIPPGQHVLRITKTGAQDDERVIEVRKGPDEQVVQAQFRPARIREPSLAPGAAEDFSARSTRNIAPESSRDTAPLEMPRDDTPTGQLPPPLLQTSPAPAFASAGPGGAPTFGMVVCSNCGMNYPSGTKFCHGCGGSLIKAQARDPIDRPPAAAWTSATQSSQASPVAKRKFPMIPIYAGAALMLLVVLIAPAWFLVLKNASNPNTGGLANRNANKNSNSAISNNSNSNTFNSNTSSMSVQDLSFTKLDGGPLQLKDLRGRVVLLNVWASWVIPSRDEIPVLNGLQESFNSRGLTVIGISYEDSPQQIEEFQKQYPQKYQIGLGDKARETKLATSPLPTTYLIDRRGRVSRKFIGAQSRATFEAAIQPLLNEAP